MFLHAFSRLVLLVVVFFRIDRLISVFPMRNAGSWEKRKSWQYRSYAKLPFRKCLALSEQLLGHINPEWNGQDAQNGAC